MISDLNSYDQIKYKVIMAVGEWLQPQWSSAIKDGGRCTYSEWLHGCHWVISLDRFRIPKFVDITYDHSIKIAISSTVTFKSCPVTERDMHTVIAITKSTITFDENCESDHFSKEELLSLYNNITEVLK